MGSEQPQDLLTPLAYELSHSAPRVPPLDSFHRAVMVGGSKRSTAYHLDCRPHVSYAPPSRATNKKRGNKHEWLGKLLRHLHLTTRERALHPHLKDRIPRDEWTRWLGGTLSVSTFNRVRDDGHFRSIAETLVTVGIPAMAFAAPKTAMKFGYLSTRVVQTIPYGTHKMQTIDLIPSTSSTSKAVLVFVHGGAWGSGRPWMYRLVADPLLPFFQGVAVVGYRTYPCATVSGQVTDLHRAFLKLRDMFPEDTPFFCMGHSSGAHIGLLHVVKLAEDRLSQSKSQDPTAMRHVSPNYHSFIGISGVYNVDHHFDYEAGRGVEELSPLKPANGNTRDEFRKNSPMLRLQKLLGSVTDEHLLHRALPHKSVFFHGMEDTTVPFTSTAEAARQLQSFGYPCVDEIYLARTGHDHAVLQLMTGGLTREKVVEWVDAVTSELQILQGEPDNTCNRRPHSQVDLAGLQSKL